MSVCTAIAGSSGHEEASEFGVRRALCGYALAMTNDNYAI